MPCGLWWSVWTTIYIAVRRDFFVFFPPQFFLWMWCVSLLQNYFGIKILCNPMEVPSLIIDSSINTQYSHEEMAGDDRNLLPALKELILIWTYFYFKYNQECLRFETKHPSYACVYTQNQGSPTFFPRRATLTKWRWWRATRLILLVTFIYMSISNSHIIVRVNWLNTTRLLTRFISCYYHQISLIH